MKSISLIFIALCLIFIKCGSAVSLDEELTITSSQKLKLDKFRKAVSSQLPHEYMKTDIYLIRWLRARNFNLQAAQRMLMENIRWRKANKIDNILKEDWADYGRDYRFTIEGCDKGGRPVISVFVGDWDVRKAVIAGQTNKMMRYFDKLMEEVNVVIRAAQAQGQNVTQYSFIFDMGNYNLVQQGCPGCIPIFVHLFTSYESHFPGGVHKLMLVNTPEIFGALLQILRPLMSKTTSDSLTVYGRDKRNWQDGLLNEISADQLTKHFGGTKEAGFEIEEFRDFGKLPC